MKFLGIDHGLKRIGVAVSDDTGLLARELAIIRRRSKKEDFATINRMAEEQRVDAIVIGLPSDLDAEPEAHTQADKVRRWTERLAAATTLPLVLWDEQMSSLDAQEIARRHNRKASDPVDDLAARVILQSYLDALRDGLATPPPRSPSQP